MIDWTQPIEWHDGTPAEVVPGSERWGKIGVYVDAATMPEGVRFNGHPWRDSDGRTYLSIIAAYGTLSDPASGIHPCIRNRSERIAEEEMEGMAWI